MADANWAGGGNVGAVPEIDALTSLGPRRAGSEAERRGARALEKRLRELGRDVQVEPARVRANFGVTHLVHLVAGIVASVLSVYQPHAGLALAVIATLSAFGDLTGTFYLARLLTPARASQNVVSGEDNGKPGLIVLVAHYDAPLTGMLNRGRLRAWPRVILASLGLITVCALGRVVGLDATWFTIIEFIPTVVLIAGAPLFVDAAIGDTATGAADNAAGVMTVLQLARSHGERLTHFDLMVVFTGASAHSGLGMRSWLKRHGRDLDPEATAVISVDDLGGGIPAFAVKEGPLFASRMHPMLVELAREAGGTAYESREISDAYIARSMGLPALRISTTETGRDDPDPDTVARVREFASALLERLDDEIGPSLR